MTFGHEGGHAFNEDQRGGHLPGAGHSRWEPKKLAACAYHDAVVIGGDDGPESNALFDAICPDGLDGDWGNANLIYASKLAKEIVEAFNTRADLLSACRAAYKHLDTYGTVTGGSDEEMASQKRVFDLLRPFCPHEPGTL